MSTAQAVLPGSTATVIGLAALGVVAFDAGWLVVRHFAVMAHEGVRRVVEVGLRSDDGIRLRGITGLPHALWFLFWLAATLAAAAEGARLLVMHA